MGNAYPDQLRIAFDGDGVLFDHSCEDIFQREQLNGFHKHEEEHARIPIPPGPLRPFLKALIDLQNAQKEEEFEITIRTCLMTARNAPAHERVVRTMLEWGIEVDEAFFLGGIEKKGFLAEFCPDFFFDDQQVHADPAAQVACTGLVPYEDGDLPTAADSSG